jgi:hypothetical protein
MSSVGQKSTAPTAPAMVKHGLQTRCAQWQHLCRQIDKGENSEQAPIWQKLYFCVHGSCTRMPCPYKEDHIKHNTANTAALIAYMAEHSAAAKAAPDQA